MERRDANAIGWPGALLGAFVGASLVLELLAPPRPQLSAAAEAFVAQRRAGARGLETDCARELERLPGVGEVRALAIAQARWAARGSGRALVLEEVPGIGPAIAEGIRAEYARTEPASTPASW
ncbi:MAG: hypothetical protein EPO68_12185, partial [Planctomycetota bacterium]